MIREYDVFVRTGPDPSPSSAALRRCQLQYADARTAIAYAHCVSDSKPCRFWKAKGTGVDFSEEIFELRRNSMSILKKNNVRRPPRGKNPPSSSTSKRRLLEA